MIQATSMSTWLAPVCGHVDGCRPPNIQAGMGPTNANVPGTFTTP